MASGILAPSAALLAVMVLSLVVLVLDTRRRRQARRIEAVTAREAEKANKREQYSSIRVEQQLDAGMRSAASKWLCVPVDLPLAHIIPVWLVVATGVSSGLLTGVLTKWLTSSALFTVPAAVVAGLLVLRSIFRWEHERYAQRLIVQLPDTIQLVGSATRAGLPVSEAVRAVAREMPSPTRDEFDRVIRELGLGRSVDEALMNVHLRTRVTEYAIFSVTLAVQARTGGRLSETIQNLADIIRQRLAIAARANALAGEAKLSARVIAVMPLVGGAMMTAIQPDYLFPLFYDPRGKNMLLVGIVTMISGIITMRQMIRGVTRE